MAYSTITLYGTSPSNRQANFPLREDKLFIIEDLETFLTPYILTTTQCQYQKHNLDLEVKLINEQINLTYNPDGTKINYVKISNSDDQYPVYYFVRRPDWRSENCLKLYLRQDTLNTLNRQAKFDHRTTVQREHKDRFDVTMSKRPEFTKSTPITSIGPVVRQGLFDVDIGGALSGYAKTIIKYTRGAERVLFDVYINNSGTGSREDSYYIEECYSVQELQIKVHGFQIPVIEGYNEKNQKIFSKTISDLEDYKYKMAIYPQRIADIEIIADGITLTDYAHIIECTIKKEGYLMRNIDFNSEGLQPSLYKTKEEVIVDKDADYTWYILYNTDTAEKETGIRGYLIPEEDMEGLVAITENKLNYENWLINSQGEKTSLFPLQQYEKDNSITWNAPKEQFGTRIYYRKNSEVKFIETKNVHGAIIFQIHKDNKLSLYYETGIGSKVISDIDDIIFDVNSVTLRNSLNETKIYEKGNYQTRNITGIYNINRTSQTINKIIKCPYSPFNVQIEEGKIVMPENVVYVDTNSETESEKETKLKGTFRFNVSKFDFFNDITNENNIFSIFLDTKYPYNNPAKRDDYHESKIYHSDFYNKNFVYDSFVYTVNMENISDSQKQTYINEPNLKMFFYTSASMNSRFLVQFTNVEPKYTSENYPGILTIERNNEFPIYNNQYFNYLNTGYNYDVKNKNRQTVSTVIGMGLQLGSQIATVATNPLAGLSIPSTVSNITNGINNLISIQDNFQRKQVELQKQKTSVSGSDDVSLLSVYTNDRAKFCTFETPELIKKQIYDLFYYTGYKTLEQKVPQTNTRKWFNFLQCDPVFVNEWNFSEDILNDLKTKYQTGVVYMHNNNGVWDLEQENENWETSVLEAFHYN